MTAQKQKRVLTSAFARSVPHSGGRSPDRHWDRDGLFLQVMPSGSRQWKQRLTVGGLRSDYGLGSAHTVPLAAARAKAADNLAAAREYRRRLRVGQPAAVPECELQRRATIAERKGIRRLGERKRALPVLAAGSRRAPSFGQAWESCIVERSRKWKDAKTALRSWRADLRHHLNGIAALPVADVTVDTLRQVLQPLAPATASKVLTRTGTVLEWAEAGEHVESNAARTLRKTWRGLGNGGAKQPRKALPWAEIPSFYARLRQRTDGAAGALALVILTALRSKEGRLARWEEIDLDAAVWTVPADRMKDGQEHQVPLSRAALALLEAAGPKKAGVVFTSRTGGPISDKALRKVMHDLGSDATPHGMRSTFRDWCGEHGVPRELAEEGLAHAVGSTVERAYARSRLVERRRTEAMEPWGEWVSGGA